MSEPAHYVLDHYTGFPYPALVASGVPGCIILTMGLVLLNRFMVRYPIPSEEVSHASAQ
jgi:hypothetical protein